MTQSPTILLYSTEPAFFERRDTWFNRRGVEVFCAMDPRSLRANLSTRRPNLLLSRGVPAGLAARELAGKLHSIEHLNVTPELFGPLVTELLQAGTARLRAGNGHNGGEE